MEISIGDEFDSFECLKLKVHICHRELEYGGKRGHKDRFLLSGDTPTIEYTIAFAKKSLKDRNKRVKCNK